MPRTEWERRVVALTHMIAVTYIPLVHRERLILELSWLRFLDSMNMIGD